MAAGPGLFRVTECFSPLVKRSSSQVKNFSEAPEYKSCTQITRASDSSELTLATWKRTALNKKKLKGHVRAGVLPNVRKDLWLGTLGVSDADSVLLAKAFGEPDDGMMQIGGRDGMNNLIVWRSQPSLRQTDELVHILCAAEQVLRGVSKLFGLPFDLDFIAPFYVIPAFGIGLDRVLCGLKTSLGHNSGSAPLVPILATLMLHFLEEWEVFAGLSNLLQRQGWIDHDESHLTTSTNMLLFLLDSHMVSLVYQLTVKHMHLFTLPMLSIEINSSHVAEIETCISIHGWLPTRVNWTMVHLAFLSSAILDYCELNSFYYKAKLYCLNRLGLLICILLRDLK